MIIIATVASLLVRLGADTRELEEGLQGASQTLQRTGQSMQQAGATMTKFVTGPVAAVGAGVLGLATKAGNYADELLDLSDATGLSTDTLQEYREVATAAGVEQDVVASSAERLMRDMGNLADGSSETAQTIEGLGVATSTADGEMRDMDDLMPEIIEGLQGIDNDTERAAAATNVFGRRASELAPVLGMTAEETEKLKQEAHDTGTVMDEDALQAANSFRETLDRLTRQVKTAFMAVGADLAPILEDHLVPIVTDTLIPALQSGIEIIGNVVEWFSNLQSTTQSLILQITGLVTALGPVLVVGGKVLPVIGSLVSILGAKAAAIAALPIGTLIAGFTAIVAAGVLIMENWESILNFVQQRFPAVISFFETLAGQIIGSLQQLRDRGSEVFERLSEAGQNLVPAFQQMWKVIAPIIGLFVTNLGLKLTTAVGVFNGIINAIVPFADTVVSTIEFIMNTLGAIIAFLTGDYEQAWELAVSAGQSAMRALRGVLDTIVAFVGGFVDTFISVWNLLMGNGIPSITENFMTSARDEIVRVGRNILRFFGTLGESIMSTIKEAFEEVKKIITGTLGDISDTVQGWTEGVTGFFSNLAGSLVGNSIVTEMTDGIDSEFTNMAGNSLDTISDFSSDSLDNFTDFAGDSFDTISDFSTDSLDSFSEFSTDSLDTLGSFGNDATEQFKLVADTGTELVGDLAREGVARFTDLTGESIDLLAGFATDTIDRFGIMDTGVGKAISSMSDDTIANVSDMAGTAFNFIDDFREDSTGAITNLATGAIASFTGLNQDTVREIGGMVTGVLERFGIMDVDIGEVIDSIGSGIRSGFESISNFIRGIWDGIAGFTSRIWDGIRNTVGGAIDAIMSPIETMRSAIEGITDVAGRIGEGVRGIGERVRGILPFAEGGIVTQPTLGLLGEAGAEAVIPLDRLDDITGGNEINVTQNFQTMTDPMEIQRATERSLKRLGIEWGIADGRIT